MPLDPAVQLQPHQERLRQDAAAVAAGGGPFRRLVFHGLGSGKTLSSMAAADALGAPYGVIAPASLRATHRRELERFGGPGLPPSSFHSYAQVGRGSLAEHTPETLVADEAHRIAGPGGEAAAARDALTRARHAVLMTGTPVRNSAAEFGPLLGVLTGQPMTPEQFGRRYVGQERFYPGGLLGRLRGQAPVSREVLRHQDELRELLAGKVDYHASAAPPVPVTDETVETEMGRHQADLYKAMIGRLPWVLRQKLRWDYPLSAQELRRARSFLTGPRQIALSDYPYRPDANPHQAFAGSGKLRAAFANLNKVITAHPQSRAVVYSNFPRAGLVPYAAALTRAGVPFGFFHGGVSPADRQKLVDDFNSGRVRVALVGPAGSEGISLKGAQLVQLLDPHWHPVRDAQAAARVLRFDSHRDLPEELRHVKIERYRSRVPPGLTGRMIRRLGLHVSPEPAADDYLAQMSANKGRAVEPLLELLRDVGTKRSAAETARDRAVREAREWIESTFKPGELDGIYVMANPGYRWALVDVMDWGDPAVGRKIEARLRKTFTHVLVQNEGVVPKPGRDGWVKLATPTRPTSAAPDNTLAELRRAKALSDAGHFQAKAFVVRDLIRQNPAHWRIDSDQGHTVGLTHRTGFRLHLPKAAIADVLPALQTPVQTPAPAPVPGA